MDKAEYDRIRYLKMREERIEQCKQWARTHPEHRARYKRERAHKNRGFILDFFNERCQECGYSTHQEILELHHINGKPEKTKMKIIILWSLERLGKFLKSGEVILLCPNCHKVKHLVKHPEN